MILRIIQRIGAVSLAFICTTTAQAHKAAGADAGIQSMTQDGISQTDPSKAEVKKEEQKSKQKNASAWWELKPYTGWSLGQVETMLGDSPWARLSSMFLLRVDAKTNLAFTKEPVGTDYRAAYQVRLITALPVREAFLRGISINPKFIGTEQIDLRLPGMEGARPNDFRLSDPNNYFEKGDEENIIISVMLITYGPVDTVQGPLIMTKPPGSDELPKADIPRLLVETYLRTDTGRQINPSIYLPPGGDGLAAKFIFQRKLPDGTPFITQADKELRLEIPLKYHRVKVKFDLRKMMYKGKLEI
jgi:hypothetical protein